MAGVPAGVPVAAPVVEDPTAMLDALPAVFIEQNISLTEVMTCCEMRNKYKVYAADPTTMDKIEGRDPLFKAQEESSCFMRQCCGAQREFNMDIYLRDRMNPEEGRGPILSHAFRPFKCCECVCFNRPEMFVKNASNQHIGHVFNPFTCCNWDVDVSGPAEHRYDNGEVDPEAAKAIAGTPWKLSAACCQLGIYCRCPCDPCKRVIFEIKDSEDNVVGELQHVFAGCCKDMVDVDNYAIRFPAGATWQQKATLINTAILIDFLFFESDTSNNGGS